MTQHSDRFLNVFVILQRENFQRDHYFELNLDCPQVITRKIDHMRCTHTAFLEPNSSESKFPISVVSVTLDAHKDEQGS